MFTCTVCYKVFTTKRSLIRHTKGHVNINFPCNICLKVFTRKEYLANHTKKTHGKYLK